jgi:hypothetical protein
MAGNQDAALHNTCLPIVHHHAVHCERFRHQLDWCIVKDYRSSIAAELQRRLLERTCTCDRDFATCSGAARE